ncbi:Undecaprenyl-diphosphatase [Micrococcus lylae]|uniref:Undecaprenyl-diphosphatase n=1 Tax=Micrococcus lylae TaxID=1273 RepID=A0A1R4I8C0_9MICC|nr:MULTISPECIES: undecaprenyl-diphosphate phosphatase [Micrococcus]MCT2007242.1 undecaprenyl-diphosphate phosphatase [Micrococcus lylae]MCT2070914.1 undecaprenyl-diphosphate phosphatase [Micrococcus lylae]OFR86226.1 UDP-diphosphatase [Micrococcus sp. HMSC067E09]PNL18015.1 undecaprenyl-diphosphate phosphatase [Micrococcus sp. FDAARGOS_333]WIK82910.1 undecaprenyl-diphosphate phosphatase [Micrococcus lylae]
MSWIEAVILGLVQGLTEFLPISSSAHLRIVGEFLPSAADPGAAFTAITQIGTELAVLIYFWKDITRIIAQWCRALSGKVPHSDPDVRMGWLIILGSLPIAILGLLLEDWIDTEFRSLWVTATMLIVFAILLALADRFGRQRKPLEQLTVRDGILYGFAQALALIPGVSRSGGTITMGLALGYAREAAARYAFLLAVPAVFASGFYKLFKSVGDPTTAGPYGMGETLLATLIAFAVGYAVIAWLMRFITQNSFMPFVWYRIALGLGLYVMLGTGLISA